MLSSEEDRDATKDDDEANTEDDNLSSSLGLLLGQTDSQGSRLGSLQGSNATAGPLNLLETAKLSFEFCVLWFVVSGLQSFRPIGFLMKRPGKLLCRWMSEIYNCRECNYTYFYKQ